MLTSAVRRCRDALQAADATTDPVTKRQRLLLQQRRRNRSQTIRYARANELQPLRAIVASIRSAGQPEPPALELQSLVRRKALEGDR